MEAEEKVLELRAIELRLAELEKEKAKLERRRKAILEVGPGTRLEKPSALSREDQQKLLRQAAFGSRQ